MSQDEFRADLRDYLSARRRHDGYHEQRLLRRLETTHAPYWDQWLRYSHDRDAIALSGRAAGRPKSTTPRATRRAERIARARARRRRRRGPLIG